MSASANELLELIEEKRINVEPSSGGWLVEIPNGIAIEKLCQDRNSYYVITPDVVITGSNITPPNFLSTRNLQVIGLKAMLSLEEVMLIHRIQKWNPASPYGLVKLLKVLLAAGSNAILYPDCYPLVTLDNPVGGIYDQSILIARWKTHHVTGEKYLHLGFIKPGPGFFLNARIVVWQDE